MSGAAQISGDVSMETWGFVLSLLQFTSDVEMFRGFFLYSHANEMMHESLTETVSEGSLGPVRPAEGNLLRNLLP